MYSPSKISNSKKGFVTVGLDKGYLRLGFPRHWFNGKQKYVSLGLADTPENRIMASNRAQLAQRDYQRYQLGDAKAFDWTLQKYKTGEVMALAVSIVEEKATLKLTELWHKYLAYKKLNVKESTYLKLSKSIGRYLAKLSPNLAYDNALEVKSQLHKLTTTQETRATLQALSAACDWGEKHGLCDKNLYKQMYKDMPKPNWQIDPEPNPFTQEEKELIIEAFKMRLKFKGDYKGAPIQDYSHYAPFVEFLFLTGCRPSEAVGLTWRQVDLFKGQIIFDRSITCVIGKIVKSQKSKNNRVRKFPCNERLLDLLNSQCLACEHTGLDDLVFPSPKGKAINYGNFSTRAWNSIVDAIKLDTTPYNCRDTFISEQLAKGVPVAVVGKWCDTSESVINRAYADLTNLTSIVPL